jgi:FkbM family methyltransferase
MPLCLPLQRAKVAPIRRSDLSGSAPFSTPEVPTRQEKPWLTEPLESVRTYPASGIISYAQNREDILLWRALQDVQEGFYVDAGAQDPTHDSVTRAFYDQGWRGINIEPATGYFEKLCAERPRDLTLQVALGDRIGWARLHEFAGTGLSTLVKEVAARHRANGFDCFERRVPILPLARVWENFVKGEVHFLKIDVEGFERQVLSGAELTRFRPWIILIEATEPLTSKGAWEDWERILLRSRYEFVHFDGLNRWYLAEERSHLKARFEAPSNVFDQFQLAAMVSLQDRLATAECTVVSLQDRLATAECTVDQMRASASWRITAPLRAAKDGMCAAAFFLRTKYKNSLRMF